jgi:hypothetical protein
MPEVVVNMQTADGRPTFLKLKLTLELPDEDAVDELDPNMPRLQDMFQSFLRELRPEDLSGSQGSYQLRMEILRRVNLVIGPSKANAVLIEEMLINRPGAGCMTPGQQTNPPRNRRPPRPRWAAPTDDAKGERILTRRDRHLLARPRRRDRRTHRIGRSSPGAGSLRLPMLEVV